MYYGEYIIVFIQCINGCIISTLCPCCLCYECLRLRNAYLVVSIGWPIVVTRVYVM